MTYLDPEYMIIVSDGHGFKAHRLAQTATWHPQLTDSINPDLVDFTDEATGASVTITVYHLPSGTESGRLVAGTDSCPLCDGDSCQLCDGEHRIAFWKWTADDTTTINEPDSGGFVLTYAPCPACCVDDYRQQHLIGRGQQ
jgi:hypothetical protein